MIPLERERPDLVSLCLPNQGHFDATLRVIEAGVPLLVEKPLVFDREEADRLLAAAAERGLFCAINFNHRYARPVQLARRDILDGRLGDLVFATWRFGGEGMGGYFNDNGRSFHHTFDAYVDALLAAFKAGQEPPVHARAGRRALALAHASIAAFSSGRRVVVGEG